MRPLHGRANRRLDDGSERLMPRSHGRIMSTIWNDPDFIALGPGPQRLYLFLLSQPDLSHAGLVPMRVNRWAKKVGGYDAAHLRADLDGLTETRFVVYDDDTEEVLIRTFVRNDGVYKQPKVMLRMREDARQIESPALRAAFRAELDRLPLEELQDGPRSAVSTVVDTLRADFADSEAYPSEGVSDTPSDTPHVRAGAFPQPPAPVPQPPTNVPATPGSAIARRDDAEVSAQTFVGEWIDHCKDRPPGRVIGHVAREVKAMLDEGIDPARVRAGLAEWHARGLHPSTLPSVVHELSTPQKRAGSRQQETDDLFSRAALRMGVIQGGQS